MIDTYQILGELSIEEWYATVVGRRVSALHLHGWMDDRPRPLVFMPAMNASARISCSDGCSRDDSLLAVVASTILMGYAIQCHAL